MSFIDFIEHWQTLIGNVIGGLFAVLAGALIFIEGSRQIAFAKREKAASDEKEAKITAQILVRLQLKTNETIERIEEDIRLIQDFWEDEGGHEKTFSVDNLAKSRTFETILTQIAGRLVDHEIIAALSDAVEDLEIYELDFNRFRNAYEMQTKIYAANPRQLTLLPSYRDPVKHEALDLLQTSAQSLIERLRNLNDKLR